MTSGLAAEALPRAVVRQIGGSLGSSVGARRSAGGVLLTRFAGFAQYAHGDRPGALPETAVLPPTSGCPSGEARRAPAGGNVVFVQSFVPVGLVPVIAAAALATAGDERSLEAVDRPAMLEPLHDAAAALQPGLAGTRPCRTVLGRRMPIPHATAELRVHQP